MGSEGRERWGRVILLQQTEPRLPEVLPSCLGGSLLQGKQRFLLLLSGFCPPHRKYAPLKVGFGSRRCLTKVLLFSHI